MNNSLLAAVPATAEDQAKAPEHPSSSPLPTPPPPSPPSSFTVPPAPATFKQPLPKNISSPTPFPITSSSPASTTFIPPPPSEAPPASSSSAGASSFGPSSAGPSIPPPPPEYSFLHPSTPPSFVTIIPESAQLKHLEIQDIKDEFEEEILRSVLQVDFATLEIPDVVFLPPLHSLIMESVVGSLIFERSAQTLVVFEVCTQAKIHEELSSSGRLEDGKEVPSIISRTEENATV
ncbi:hypothetical protein Taro_055374 [Colocasia esculenta]|uniref:Uncharacterized protein n=1 Tax=Colocasia esculenta TaxID=4460 RepID=A0A843XT41_COLES|nr:hypothetical protein [Colocasia esculenta]